MSFMRRVESRVEKLVGAMPAGGAPDHQVRARPKKNSKLYVRPAELGHKLVKEMEARRVSHSSKDVVCNTYTVYLCPEDFRRLYDRREEIEDELANHLLQHARRKRYLVAGRLSVSVVVDDGLPLGKFGILAERYDHPRPPAAVRSVAGPVEEKDAGGGTRVIPAGEAEALGLARQTIVVKAGNSVREFTKGRVVIGRGRDADFRVNDPNVSRRHAVILWDEGRLVVQDLNSTNGTIVNGYPVSTTVLRPNDVLVVGECRMTVDSR